MWQCQICTYENHYSLPVCEMCDSRRADDEIIHIVCSTTSVIYLVSKQVRSLQGGTENSGTYVRYVTYLNYDQFKHMLKTVLFKDDRQRFCTF